MADDKTNTAELDNIALEIFSKQIATNRPRRNGEHEAVHSYRMAEAFLKVRSDARKGALKAPPPNPNEPQLCEWSAPNRARTDPHNLISTRFGNLDSVARIKKWLDENPTPESNQMEIVERLKAKFPELQWGRTDVEVFASISTARVLFPAYVRK